MILQLKVRKLNSGLSFTSANGVKSASVPPGDHALQCNLSRSPWGSYTRNPPIKMVVLAQSGCKYKLVYSEQKKIGFQFCEKSGFGVVYIIFRLSLRLSSFWIFWILWSLLYCILRYYSTYKPMLYKLYIGLMTFQGYFDTFVASLKVFVAWI